MIESKNIVNILEWLDKFRRRIVIMFVIPFILTIFAYFISDNILKIISVPLMDKKLYFLTPVEAIMTKLKISFFCGLIMSLPILISIIISMVSEFVPKKTLTKLYIFVVPVFSMALVAGITFGYKLVLPTTLKFLINVGDGFMEPMISGSSYVSFITFFLISIGIVFELPLILICLSRVGIIKSSMLRGKRKIVILFSVIIMAILTPTPDAFTLLVVSLPMILLYELSLWIIYFLEWFDIRREKKGM
jgi:sec-independent protein translocase protein TatC